MKSSTKSILIEIGKWGVVLYLLLPVGTAMTSRTQVFKIVAGIALAIIFVGKTFYDTIIYKFTRSRDSTTKDIITFLGILVVFLLVIAFFIGILGFVLMHYYQSLGQSPDQN
ncbi:hypothetical protein BMS3Abin05_01496 [bacterium BMS3Abin05]|nr:hypothetical protein BMS3Abin05_01496 [bacterium BMS3Abin05]GBE27070.1 hypothetical protein BMS3Bbin03_00990 [bacterium BMS3Bbin03]HDZ11653.1 hypothetical protein [Bacteroidota bacterium]